MAAPGERQPLPAAYGEHLMSADRCPGHLWATNWLDFEAAFGGAVGSISWCVCLTDRVGAWVINGSRTGARALGLLFGRRASDGTSRQTGQVSPDHAAVSIRAGGNGANSWDNVNVGGAGGGGSGGLYGGGGGGGGTGNVAANAGGGGAGGNGSAKGDGGTCTATEADGPYGSGTNAVGTGPGHRGKGGASQNSSNQFGGPGGNGRVILTLAP